MFELTREQFKKLLLEVRAAEDSHQYALALQAVEAHDAALRFHIDILAAEVDTALAESEKKLRELCMVHGPLLIEHHDLQQKFVVQVEGATLRVERDQARLAERDARIAELEGEIELCRSMNAQLRQAPHQWIPSPSAQRALTPKETP